ncbi:MAG: hypothetical protein PHW34_09025 [Hespellia sp.]|nr:hypothetical protein [Hespellia sp.]
MANRKRFKNENGKKGIRKKSKRRTPSKLIHFLYDFFLILLSLAMEMAAGAWVGQQNSIEHQERVVEMQEASGILQVDIIQ